MCMITDYQVIPIAHADIHSVILWNHHFWLNHKQLQQLLHVNKSKLERMIAKLAAGMNLYPHQKVFSIATLRKKADGACECIYQIRHYDEEVLKQLTGINSEDDVATLFMLLDKVKTEVKQ